MTHGRLIGRNGCSLAVRTEQTAPGILGEAWSAWTGSSLGDWGRWLSGRPASCPFAFAGEGGTRWWVAERGRVLLFSADLELLAVLEASHPSLAVSDDGWCAVRAVDRLTLVDPNGRVAWSRSVRALATAAGWAAAVGPR